MIRKTGCLGTLSSRHFVLFVTLLSYALGLSILGLHLARAASGLKPTAAINDKSEHSISKSTSAIETGGQIDLSKFHSEEDIIKLPLSHRIFTLCDFLAVKYKNPFKAAKECGAKARKWKGVLGVKVKMQREKAALYVTFDPKISPDIDPELAMEASLGLLPVGPIIVAYPPGQ